MRKLAAAGAMALGLALLPLTAAHAGSNWLVGIKANQVQVVAGHKIVFRGTVRPHGAAAGQKVVLQEKFKPGKPWVDQKKVTVRGDGSYRVSDTPTTNFTHAYRVVVPGTSKHAKGISPTVKVKVYKWTRLADLASVNDQGMESGNVNINGKAYQHSVFARWSSDTHIEYNVNHRCTKLQASFGISDDSSTGGQAEVDVLADGTPVYTHTFDVGQHQTKTIALDEPLKLRLEATSTSTGGPFGLGAFGNATALCTK